MKASISGFNPSGLLSIEIPYETLFNNADANFFRGIKALV